MVGLVGEAEGGKCELPRLEVSLCFTTDEPSWRAMKT